MLRHTLALALTVVLTSAIPGRTADENADALTKSVDMGDLGDQFTLVKVEHELDPQRGGTIRFKLEAKKDVDTAGLSYKVGFFEADKHLEMAHELRFRAEFPLKKGERITAEAFAGRESKTWPRLVIRKVDKPAPKEQPARSR
jgi:hypothetical protein